MFLSACPEYVSLVNSSPYLHVAGVSVLVYVCISIRNAFDYWKMKLAQTMFQNIDCKYSRFWCFGVMVMICNAW